MARLCTFDHETGLEVTRGETTGAREAHGPAAVVADVAPLMITEEKSLIRILFFRDHGIGLRRERAGPAWVRAAGRNRYPTCDGLAGVLAREGALDDRQIVRA
jgi:hypothetical protein